MSARRRRPAPARRNVGGRKGKTKMPACTYGAACTRKGCIYSHPPKRAGGAEKKSTEFCLHYVAGHCPYGKRCKNRHPSQARCEELRRTYATQPCRFGDNCHTEGCLYRHSWTPAPPLPAAAAAAAAFVPAAYRPSAAADTGEWGVGTGMSLLSACDRLGTTASPAETMAAGGGDGDVERRRDPSDGNLYSLAEFIAFYGGSSQWDSLAPAAAAAAVPAAAPPELCPPATVASAAPGAAAHEGFAPPPPFNEALGPDDPEFVVAPAATASFLSGGPVDNQTPVAPPVPASIRAAASLQAPAPAPAAPAPSAGALLSAGLGGLRLTSAAAAQGRGGGPRVVRIPEDLWTDQSERNAAACFAIADPMARFEAVNAGGKPGVVDLHFQSLATVRTVLDRVLGAPAAYYGGGGGGGGGGDHRDAAAAAAAARRRRQEEATAVTGGGGGVLWLVTGSGHHAEKGQRKTGLREAVEAYLQEWGMEYELGRDKKGHVGAFRVKC